MAKSNFETLSEVLFDGDVKAVDVKIMPGSSENIDREVLAEEMLASMKRMGIVADGKLVDINS